MSSELGWNSATTSLAFSISNVVEGIFSIILGGLSDKYGPRKIMTLCGILIGLGYGLMFFVHSIWQLYLFYGLILGVGMGGIFVPTITMIVRWFKTRRNVMTGIVAAGSSVGLLIVAPLANHLIDAFSWRTSFLIFGIAIFAIISVASQFLKRDPSVMDLKPFGEQNTVKTSTAPLEGLTYRETIRTNQFWLVFGVFFAFGFYSASISIHLVPDAIKNGINSSTAAYILTTTGIFAVIGRISMGLLGDKIGNRSIYLLGLGLFTLNIFWLITGNSLAAFFLFAVVFGISQGGLITSQSPFIASLFGLKQQGLIFGLAGFGCTLGMAAGPYITGFLFDATNSYKTAFLLCAIISALGIILTQLIKPVKHATHERTKL